MTLLKQSLAAALVLCALCARAESPATSSPDFSTAPKVPQRGDCIGYPDESAHMPASFKQQIDAANKRYKKEGDLAEDQFLRATGRAGKEWEEEKSASVMRYSNAVDHIKMAEIPRQAADGSPWTPEQKRKFELEAAQETLESVRAENRDREEEALAALHFVQHGGDSTEITILEKGTNDRLASCHRDAGRIYQAWWSLEKKK